MELVDACCSTDPARRPSMQHVFQNARAWHGELLGSGSADASTPLSVKRLTSSAPTAPATQAASSGASLGAHGDRRPPPALQAIVEDQEVVASPDPRGLAWPHEQQSRRPLAPAFACTAPDTVEAMVVEVMISCNLLIPADACCSFHGAAQEIGHAVRRIASQGCKNFLDHENVRCQCSHCGVLVRDSEVGSSSSSLSQDDRCAFCGELMVEERASAGVSI